MLFNQNIKKSMICNTFKDNVLKTQRVSGASDKNAFKNAVFSILLNATSLKHHADFIFARRADERTVMSGQTHFEKNKLLMHSPHWLPSQHW